MLGSRGSNWPRLTSSFAGRIGSIPQFAYFDLLATTRDARSAIYTAFLMQGGPLLRTTTISAGRLTSYHVGTAADYRDSGPAPLRWNGVPISLARLDKLAAAP